MNGQGPNLARRKHEALARLKPAWNEARTRLEVMFPTATVSGRLRGDVYGDGDGILARDSAGIRIVVPDADDLKKALAELHRAFRVSEVRDYRSGRTRSPYYRAVHLYVPFQGFEIEIQLRTRRHHRLATWTHDRLFVAPGVIELVEDPDVVPWLVSLANAFDELDAGQFALPPPPPAVLLPHIPALGVAPDSGWCLAPTSAVPLLSHATKDKRCITSIVAEGAIQCADMLPDWVPKFGGFTEAWAGRTSSVMLSLGFGYLVDNANMCAAFVFSEDVALRPTTQVHKTAEVFWICCLILETVRQLEHDYWIEFFSSAGACLRRFDNPHLRTSFSEYMLHQLRERDAPPSWRDVWGPSAFSEGVIRLLYLGNPRLQDEIERKISAFRRGNRLPGGSKALNYIRHEWDGPGIYRTPSACPLPDQLKAHIQILVAAPLRIDDGACVGICLAPRALRALDAIGAVRDQAVSHLGLEIPVYCGGLVAPLATYLAGIQPEP